MDGQTGTHIPSSNAGWQQQVSPDTTTTPSLAEYQPIDEYNGTYSDTYFQTTVSSDGHHVFDQTGVGTPSQHFVGPMDSAMAMGMPQLNSFEAPINAGIAPNGWDNYYATPGAEYNTDELPGAGVGISDLMATPSSPATQTHVRNSWTRDQDAFLLSMRGEGRTYNEIAVEMGNRFPSMGKITINRLVKRAGKIQDQALDKKRPSQNLSKAVKRAMPRIVACIQDEADGLGIDQGDYSQVMLELTQALPLFVQRKITNRHVRQSRNSLTRGANH
ncbi:hypothetical protein V8F20_001466 [Naviculisporaceae sp. PSN 640]